MLTHNLAGMTLVEQESPSYFMVKLPFGGGIVKPLVIATTASVCGSGAPGPPNGTLLRSWLAALTGSRG
jgi:hypothetical protein